MPAPVQEPQQIPETSLSEKIKECQSKQAAILARGGDVPLSMIRELENLLTEAESVKAP
jgi:hypothetical protein